LKLMDSDEESSASPAGASPQIAMRRSAQSAHLMASAACILAIASATLLAAAALGGAGQQQGVAIAPREVLGLTGNATSVQEERVEEGWYRTFLNAMVRKDEAMDSEKVDVVPAGTLIYVKEVRGRRAHVLRPIAGWLSLQTRDGTRIVRRDMSYTGEQNRTAVEDVFRSEEMREAAERLQAATTKLTAVEEKVLVTFKKMNLQHLSQMFEARSAEVVERAPKIGETVARSTAHALKHAIKPGAGKQLLQQVKQNSHIRSLVEQRPKLSGIASQVKDGVDAMRKEVRGMKDLKASGIQR